MILSNVGMEGVRAQIALNACSSFEYFANTVLGRNLSEELCAAVQEVVEDGEDWEIRCTRPRELAVALASWLEAHGANVLCTVYSAKPEILEWLQLDQEPKLQGRGVVLELAQLAVVIKWL